MASRGRFRLTSWIAYADFFTAIALLALTLYAVKLREIFIIKQGDKNVAIQLCEALRIEGVDRECDQRSSAVRLPATMLFESFDWEIRDKNKVAKIQRAIESVSGQWKSRRFQLIIQGHTDDWPVKSEVMDNLELSRRRARSMEVALAELGIKAPRFYVAAEGLGETVPLVDNCIRTGDASAPRSRWASCAEGQRRPAEQLGKNRRLELQFGFFSGSQDDENQEMPNSRPVN